MRYWWALAALACLSGTAAFADTPIQQVRDGTDPLEVECGNLALMVRPPADPACVFQSSVERLSERGWSLVEAAPDMPDAPAADMPEAAGTAISGAYSPGPFAVGASLDFFTDPSRPFDAWGRAYKNAEYLAMLDRIDASGQRATVPVMTYYPAVPGEGTVERAAFHPAPLLRASEGARSTLLDLYAGNEDLARGNRMMAEPSLQYQSYSGAQPADGRFPLVVMIHGLGGGLTTWNSAAEYLASHGYVVAALAYTSDSISSPVFEDPDSPFASEADLGEAYRLRAEAPFLTVFSNIMSMMYGYEEYSSLAGLPDPSTLSARPGGGVEAGRMMGNLFEQRLDDLRLVIASMESLDGPEERCRDELGQRGKMCGVLEGMIDTDSVGVMGHSIGSMTSQAALEFVPEVDTAVGFNNGMPKRWEPYGGLPGLGLDPPAGVPKDVMLVIGSDDFFIYRVFSEIHLRWYEEAGGDIDDTYPLPSERARPSAANPQPVATSAYERAQAAKVLLTFRDQGHGNATDDVPGAHEPGSVTTGTRVPLGPGAPPEQYTALTWMADEGGYVHMPHQMRNYFVTAWFDWQLKGDDSARQAVLDHPFEGAASLVSEGLGP